MWVTLDNAALLAMARPMPIPSFPVMAPVSNMLWLPYANLAVHHPHLDRAELARAVTRQWSGSGRVSIRHFEEHQSAADNAAGVVECTLENLDDGWPARSRAEFHGWLFGLRRGLQPLGVSSRSQRERDVLCTKHIKDFMLETGRQGSEIEPMPVLF